MELYVKIFVSYYKKKKVLLITKDFNGYWGKITVFDSRKGNDLCFGLSGRSRNRRFEKSGFHAVGKIMSNFLCLC